MKKILFIICTALSTSITSVFAQLPPAAQALYDSAYAQDPIIVDSALTNGAQILATPDGNSFYVQWFPNGSAPNTTPLIVSMHGSHCNAFMEFRSWHQQALQHGCGIIALQWYRYRPNPPYDYFPDDTLYSYFDSALTNISYPSGKVLLHGFSRGSARSYAIIFKDIQSGNNYFCTTISNSGSADPNYPLYDSINSGVYGPNVFAGKHWNLFCGGLDTIVGCAKMTNTQTWLQGQGATVDIFIQDPALDHDGFQMQSSFAYKDSILDNYLLCYNGTLSVGEELNKTGIRVFPNPFSWEITLKMKDNFNNATLTVYNSFGKQVKQLKNISEQTITLHRDNLPSGLYFLRLTQDNKTISADKLVITDN
ncbi:MAG: T9SS type A sorting domain-containing protein [Bacteroidetes bacterium]|nr:T9SS type A sorting domain-containing protein [Bacteroidota bacterium]